MIEDFLKYLQFEKRVSPHTKVAYEKDLEQFSKFLSSIFPDETIDCADHGMVRTWLVSLVDQGLEPASVNRKIASLRAFYKFLMREENLFKDPMKKIVALKTKKNLPSFIKEGEISTLLDNPRVDFEDTFEGKRDHLILEMFYATGIRLSELLNLEDGSIDLHNCALKVLGKRNKERVIPFSKNLVSIIKEYITLRNKKVVRNNRVFFVSASGDPCYPMMIYRMVKKHLGANTTVEKQSPHVLRHSFATHLLDKGAEINAVKDLLGHSSLAATQIYTHNSMEKLKKAFDQAHPKA